MMGNELPLAKCLTGALPPEWCLEQKHSIRDERERKIKRCIGGGGGERKESLQKSERKKVQPTHEAHLFNLQMVTVFAGPGNSDRKGGRW